MRFLNVLLCAVFMTTPAVYAAKRGPATVTLDADNTAVLRGEVSDESVGQVIADLENLKDPNVFLVIDSPGGSVFAGAELVSYLGNTDKHVTCVAKTAISMAFVILQACHERIGLDTSVLMQHVTAYSLKGREPNNLTFALFITKYSRVMDEAQAKRIGISYDKFRSLTISDWWLVGEEAAKAGVVDSVRKVKCTTSLLKSRKTVTVSGMFSSAQVEFSGCPLVGAPVSVKSQFNMGQTPEAVQELRALLRKVYADREREAPRQ